MFLILMVQLRVDQMLQFLGGIPFFGVDTGLDEQSGGVDAGLLQRQS